MAEEKAERKAMKEIRAMNLERRIAEKIEKASHVENMIGGVSDVKME